MDSDIANVFSLEKVQRRGKNASCSYEELNWK